MTGAALSFLTLGLILGVAVVIVGVAVGIGLVKGQMQALADVMVASMNKAQNTPAPYSPQERYSYGDYEGAGRDDGALIDFDGTGKADMPDPAPSDDFSYLDPDDIDNPELLRAMMNLPRIP